MTKSIRSLFLILFPVIFQLAGCKKKELAITKPTGCFWSSVKDEAGILTGHCIINYDKNLRPIGMAINRFPVTKVGIEYGKQGNISKINTRSDIDDKLDAELTFSYDTQNRLSNVAEFLVSQNTSYRNVTFEYNSEGKITAIQTIFRRFRIEYLPTGNVSKVFEVISNGKEYLVVENLRFDTNPSPYYNQVKAVKDYWLFHFANIYNTPISYLLSPNNLLEADWYSYSNKISNTTNSYNFDASNNTVTSFKHKIKFYQPAPEYELDITMNYVCNP